LIVAGQCRAVGVPIDARGRRKEGSVARVLGATMRKTDIAWREAIVQSI
jgi:hypothetical protein